MDRELDEIEKQILEELKKGECNIYQLSKKIRISYPSIHKRVELLHAENFLKTKYEIKNKVLNRMVSLK